MTFTLYLQIGTKREPTSVLEPLTFSRYEFACTRSRASYCVRFFGLFMGFWALLARLFVHCVLACTSPVAVLVAVHAWSATRARDEVCGLGQGTTAVGVVGRVCLDLEELIAGQHSRCEGLPLLP